MIKQMITGIIYIILATIIIYPVSSTIADAMTTLMGNDLWSTITITCVRYIGFFIGIFTVKWIINEFNPPINQNYDPRYYQ